MNKKFALSDIDIKIGDELIFIPAGEKYISGSDGGDLIKHKKRGKRLMSLSAVAKKISTAKT